MVIGNCGQLGANQENGLVVSHDLVMCPGYHLSQAQSPHLENRDNTVVKIKWTLCYSFLKDYLFFI